MKIHTRWDKLIQLSVQVGFESKLSFVTKLMKNPVFIAFWILDLQIWECRPLYWYDKTCKILKTNDSFLQMKKTCFQIHYKLTFLL